MCADTTASSELRAHINVIRIAVEIPIDF